MGPAAYDVASLLQDARVDVSEEMEIELLGRYVRARKEAEDEFDIPGFVRIYSTLAAQRASKILGIFARLDRRDGKPQYLRHLPRVWNYLQRSLAHPALAPLEAWYRANVPPPESAGDPVPAPAPEPPESAGDAAPAEVPDPAEGPDSPEEQPR
jgi:aminoglycoside/choline kinase family phosphotransferase